MALTSKQQSLLSALMVSPTVAAAAKSAGIHERTAYKMLACPEFREAYRAARQNALTSAVALLQQSAALAVVVLRKMAADENQPPAVRVSAAGKLMDHAFRTGEADLAERVEELEKMIEQLAASRGVRIA